MTQGKRQDHAGGTIWKGTIAEWLEIQPKTSVRSRAAQEDRRPPRTHTKKVGEGMLEVDTQNLEGKMGGNRGKALGVHKRSESREAASKLAADLCQKVLYKTGGVLAGQRHLPATPPEAWTGTP